MPGAPNATPSTDGREVCISRPGISLLDALNINLLVVTADLESAVRFSSKEYPAWRLATHPLMMLFTTQWQAIDANTLYAAR
jgi:hypothetical protein